MHNAENPNLAEEAKAFDSQIEERIAHGHIPDLRRCEPCDWFRNNPWRRPAYIELDFGEQFALIRDTISKYVSSPPKDVRVLEVGCGPGYMSLELARAGFTVIGIDVSAKCIEVAERFALEDPYAAERGALGYAVADFISDPFLQPASFDVLLFLGALHHFRDQTETLNRAAALLKPEGIIVAHEPVRDRVTRSNAVFMHLIHVLLSVGGGFYKRYPIPLSPEVRELEIRNLFSEMRYEGTDGNKLQSVNDNEAGYTEIRPALDARFTELNFCWRYAFFHEVIGGLRFDEITNSELAYYLREIDRELCELGALSATEFFYVGQKK